MKTLRIFLTTQNIAKTCQIRPN